MNTLSHRYNTVRIYTNIIGYTICTLLHIVYMDDMHVITYRYSAICNTFHIDIVRYAIPFISMIVSICTNIHIDISICNIIHIEVRTICNTMHIDAYIDMQCIAYRIVAYSNCCISQLFTYATVVYSNC